MNRPASSLTLWVLLLALILLSPLLWYVVWALLQ